MIHLLKEKYYYISTPLSFKLNDINWLFDKLISHKSFGDSNDGSWKKVKLNKSFRDDPKRYTILSANNFFHN